MKKVLVGVLSVGLVFGGFLGGSISVGATGESSNLVEAASYSKTVTENKTYSKSATIPSSIPYNSGGWTGTLSNIDRVDVGDYWLVTFRGTVTCSTNCAMTKTTEE